MKNKNSNVNCIKFLVIILFNLYLNFCITKPECMPHHTYLMSGAGTVGCWHKSVITHVVRSSGCATALEKYKVNLVSCTSTWWTLLPILLYACKRLGVMTSLFFLSICVCFYKVFKFSKQFSFCRINS